MRVRWARNPARERWHAASHLLSRNPKKPEENTMTVRTSDAVWRGNLKEGAGRMKLGSGAFEGDYSFPSRFESGQGTNPRPVRGRLYAQGGAHHG
jgi:hypothetical protein